MLGDVTAALLPVETQDSTLGSRSQTLHTGPAVFSFLNSESPRFYYIIYENYRKYVESQISQIQLYFLFRI
jgi:hypothetical protein